MIEAKGSGRKPYCVGLSREVSRHERAAVVASVFVLLYQ
jgi:hypothetical protein